MPQLSSGFDHNTGVGLTLLPDEKFATGFFADEVEGYIATFQNRIKYLTGGHVKGYDVERVPQPDGRLIVKVIQNVSAK